MSEADSPASVNINAGHRDRLRERFAQAGSKALADYELLELVLFRAIPRRDVKPIAKALLARFGSFAEVIGAPVARLKEVDFIGDAAALDLKIIEAAAIRLAAETMKTSLALGSFAQVLDYCRSAMAFAPTEQFRVLFLDKKNKLIADEVQGQGTVDHTPVYPREVIRRALELHASALILVHNHPSGDPTPSPADIVLTQEIAAMAKPLGVNVHDHLIVGRNGHTSLRAQRLF